MVTERAFLGLLGRRVGSNRLPGALTGCRTSTSTWTTCSEACILRLALSSPLLKDVARVHSAPARLSEEDVADLIKAGVLEPSATRPHITLPVFSIPKKDGSKRLLVDGRKFDGLATPLPPPLLPKLADFESFVRRFAFFSVLDFLGYFLQIPIHEDLRRFLGLRMLGANGKSEYYQFTVAVPGIARAPLAAQLCTLAVRRLAGVSRESVATTWASAAPRCRRRLTGSKRCSGRLDWRV